MDDDSLVGLVPLFLLRLASLVVTTLVLLISVFDWGLHLAVMTFVNILGGLSAGTVLWYAWSSKSPVVRAAKASGA